MTELMNECDTDGRDDLSGVPGGEHYVRLADVLAALGTDQASLAGTWRALRVHPPKVRVRGSGQSGVVTWFPLGWLTLWLDRVLDGGLDPQVWNYLARKAQPLQRIKRGEF